MRQLSPVSDPEAYEARVTSAVLKAIFDASMTEIDGKPTAYVATTEVMEALINVMASLMEGAPSCKTPAGIREMSESVARKLNARTREVRQIIAETGQLPFTTQVITKN